MTTPLSSRETQVRDLMLSGMQNKHIARELGIGVKTVESHRARVMRKTGAASLAELVRKHCTPSDEAMRLAIEIADEDAWELVQCECLHDGGGWYDTSTADPIACEGLERDLRYLTLRDLIERHVEHPHLVRLRALAPTPPSHADV